MQEVHPNKPVEQNADRAFSLIGHEYMMTRACLPSQCSSAHDRQAKPLVQRKVPLVNFLPHLHRNK